MGSTSTGPFSPGHHEDRPGRTRKTCVRKLHMSRKRWTLPDGNNAQEVCTLNTCECVDISTRSDEQEPGRHDRHGGCTAGDPVPKRWEDADPDDATTWPKIYEYGGTAKARDRWLKDWREWRCLNELDEQGWPKGTEYETWNTYQEWDLCTCYKECAQVPDTICTCKPNPSELGDDGKFIENCTLITSMPKDYKPLENSTEQNYQGTRETDTDTTQTENPVTEKEMKDSYWSHMNAWASYAPCEHCDWPDALTWDPNGNGNFIPLGDINRTPSPDGRPNNQKDRAERLEARISKRDAMAHWQSSRTLNADGDWVPADTETTPSTTTPITVPPPEDDCCVILNVNAYMFDLIPLDQDNRFSTKWKALGAGTHMVNKICLTEQQKIEGVEVKINPMRFDNRPPGGGAMGGIDLIRWKEEKFKVFCEKGEYPSKGKPNYQFHCGGGEFGQPGSGRRKLWMIKATWEDCGEPCIKDPTKCECTHNNSKTINVDIDLSRVLDDLAALPIIGNIVGALGELVGETGTENFLQQVIAKINGEGVPQFNCSCKAGRPLKLAEPDVPPNSIISLVPGLGESHAIEEVRRILETGEIPPNSQKHMCPAGGQGSHGMSAGGNERKPYVVLRIRRSNQGADYFDVRRTGKAGDNNDPHSESRPVSGMQNPRWGGEQKRNYALWLAENGVMYRHTHDIYISTGTGAATRYWKV